ncbi:hypothetical protein CEXT_560191 [Caerostris extrusa]|uniref:Uncharacterized protein n=1 Tax=Caerostris extrusa TaxID=172846 RepID=A0AAV4MIJ9_CAEEX|nr:hypothetical protein CEXT_560191 [Caerostris extrusa]
MIYCTFIRGKIGFEGGGRSGIKCVFTPPCHHFMLARVDTSDNGSGSEHTGGSCIDSLLKISTIGLGQGPTQLFPLPWSEEECNTRWLRVVGLQ